MQSNLQAERIAHARQLFTNHAAFTAQAERATRTAYILAGAVIACGVISLAALLLCLPTMPL